MSLTLAASPAVAAGMLDPGLKWSTLPTEHFEVHFAPASLEHDARIVATIAEETHATLTAKMGWSPRAKTHIVVSDSSDFANGLTMVFPYPRILIYLAHPTASDALDSNDDWLRTLISHEYSHVIMMDMVAGLPGMLRHVFGRTIAMNSLSPDWLLEGFATWEETDLTTLGRGRGTYTDMIVRTDFLAGRNLDIGRAGDGRIRWPGGETPYIYGLAFMQWLAETKGEDKVYAYLRQYSKQAVPFMVSRAAKHAFGVSMITLWREWQTESAKRYEAIRKSVEAIGIREGKRVTTIGYNVSYPTMSPDGGVFFYDLNPHESPRINRLDLATGKIEKIASARVMGNMTVTTDGKYIYYPGLNSTGDDEYSFRYYQYTVLSVMATAKKKSRESDSSTAEARLDDKHNRLFKLHRVSDPCVAPDGVGIVYVQKNPGGDSLVLDRLDGSGEPVVLFDKSHMDPPRAIVIDTPRFSPDGKFVAFSLRDGAKRDIYSYSIELESAVEITSDIARDVSPSWSPDGKYILYSSDGTGIANIYAFDNTTMKTYSVTNVLGGAFDPIVTPDGKNIVYRGYTHAGYDLFVMPFDPATWIETPMTSSTMQATPTPAAPHGGEVKKYFPISTMLPRYLLPTIWYNGVEFQAGLTTGGSDPLGENMWGATARWGSASNFVSWGAVYQNDQTPLTFAMSFEQYAVSYGSILLAAKDVNGDGLISVPSEFFYMSKDYFEKRTVGSVGLGHTFYPWGAPLTIAASYSYEDRANLESLPNMVFDSLLPDRGVLSGFELMVGASYLKQYAYSISPEAGVSFQGWFEILDGSLGSDFDQRIYSADVRAFVPMPWLRHHVVALRAAGGVMDGDKLFQGTFRVGGTIGESVISSPGNKFFALRGFETNQFIGDEAVVFSGEYRFPIGYPERAFGLAPLFFQKVHGAVFADYGGAFDRKSVYPLTIDGHAVLDTGGNPVYVEFEKSDDWNMGVGAEIRVTGIVGWGILGPPITVRAGIAQDVIGDGIGPTWYLDLGTTF